MDCEDFFFSTPDDEILFKQIDEDLDFAFALSLQEEFNKDPQETVKQFDASHSSKSKSKPASLIDDEWELVDPNPDIHALFLEFNAQFFYGKLEAVEHEMIHAYLFVTENNKDHDAHGPQFLSHMHRINKEAGTKISVYHSFHDEVDLYRTHWWKCDGPCQNRRPFYGIVKRAMNRAPGPRDNWWAQHQASCGGKFSKIKEPENYKQKSLKRKPQDIKNEKPSAGIKNFFGPSTSKSSTSTLSNIAKKHKGADISTLQSVFAKEENLVSVMSGLSSTPTTSLREINPPVPFAGRGFELGSTSSEAPKSFLAKLRKDIGYPKEQVIHQNLSSVKTVQPSSREKNLKNSDSLVKESATYDNSAVESKIVDKSKLRQSSIENFIKSPLRASNEKDHQKHDTVSQNSTDTVKCPVCSKVLSSVDINTHLDQCLLTGA
ncbi:sprT-like domain-containing protein Spartan [Trichonephila inaurata madagascariensis]|uniref:Protein with SprT-like domain at the N terminus n=1 Tax=Trichonephila inaurata madagascariensis TaxID=2747483 RepID=A0A8X6XL83_9ARAC|nr:sprT-like domain-containing protein Spartan [Trichonephila inaurata madagascariensis]